MRDGHEEEVRMVLQSESPPKYRVRKEALHPEIMAQEAPIPPVKRASVVTEPNAAVDEAQQ